MPTRAELDAAMLDLERQIPDLKAKIPEEWQLEAWARHADEIRDAAEPEDKVYVFDCLEAMAYRHGLTEHMWGAGGATSRASH